MAALKVLVLEWLAHRHMIECRSMASALHSNDNLAAQQVHAFFRGPVLSMAYCRNLGPQTAKDRNHTIRLDRSTPDLSSPYQRTGERHVTKNFARVRTNTFSCMRCTCSSLFRLHTVPLAHQFWPARACRNSSFIEFLLLEATTAVSCSLKPTLFSRSTLCS
jgi:hypothetical protein